MTELDVPLAQLSVNDDSTLGSPSPTATVSTSIASPSASITSGTVTSYDSKREQDDPTPIDAWAMQNSQCEKRLGEDVVVVRGLTKHFSLPGRTEVVQALKQIDLQPGSPFYPVKRGEFVMIRGPSGGGKTTLLNILGTIDDPTGGEVEIFGQKVNSESKDSFLADLRLRKIGFVFQTFNLLATMSAFENVELPMTILNQRSAKDRKKRALELLDMVGLKDRYSHLPSELSGGEQQRVTIARALANEPELLLLDEPTGDLDTRNTVDIMDLILAVNQERQTTCIMVTHNPDLECYADRILYVEDGQFKKQAINRKQVKLDYEVYLKYINSAEGHGH